MCERFKSNPIFNPGVRAAYAGGPPVLLEDELTAPLHKKKPAVIGVQFMGDLFHKGIDIGWLTHIFDVIEQCQQHKFVILTKRPDNALRMMWGKHNGGWRYFGDGDYHKNIILGISVENQKAADERIPMLLQIPAAKRFVSIEPCLEDINFRQYLDKLYGWIDWVVVGCESGTKRRPCNIEWVRSIVQQCRATGVTCYVKQISLKGCRKCRFDACVHLHGHRQVDIVSHNPAEWPEDLRVQELPK
jgi:protein gp37